MTKLVRIKLRGSNRIIDVIPPVAAARVNGGTAEYVFAEDAQPETAALAGAPETATAKSQNPPAKQGRGKK